MKKKLFPLSLALILFMPLLASATHLAGGYISYTIDPERPLKYNFRLTLFHDGRSSVEDPTAQITMGDGITRTVDRKGATHYRNHYIVSTYVWEYSYQQQGTYIVSWNGVNRSHGLVNLPPNLDQMSQYVHTRIQARFTNVNSNSVRTIVPAPVEAYTGEPFRMSLMAYDADADKLTYELVPSAHVAQNGVPGPIPGYQFPAGITVSDLGELRWQNPDVKGQYALSVKITEHRGDYAIGYTIVDMQLNVVERTLQPRVMLLNKQRLTVNYDGSILARPDERLKLEFYVKKPDNVHPIRAAQFSDLDTLKLASPDLAVRDTANGLAVTITLTPGTELVREEPYTIGLRGGTQVEESFLQHPVYMYDWGFAYVLVAAQQPNSAEEVLSKAGYLLYPNPVSDRFTIEAPDMPAMRIQLYSATGKAAGVLALKPGRNDLTRPAGTAGGLYFYTITSRHKPIGSGRLIMQ